MRPELWSHVTDLMHRSLDVPGDERAAWLAAQAHGNRELIAEVERLLEAHGAAGGFLETPAAAAPGAAAAIRAALPGDAAPPLEAGSVLGQYRIIREIGHGGMGTVYLAARADDAFEKQVAIKIAPGALFNAALGERFTRERQLLATFDHPGIARLIDGGAAAGQQYLVMEYVDGTPIDAYCLSRRLDVRTRLRLFLEVCRAVQYAHDRLIVHRDIKASNVLVGPDGRARLLDFGIAKLLAPDDAASDAGATRLQAWTPESASPEQVRGGPTTVATDVYGLGALLYRLLTGGPVFDLSGRDTVEHARIICETEPARPSAAAAARSRDLVMPAAAADLDAIALKALHKEPGRRYRSAEHLAEDVERYLAGRPVLAAPDSAVYRARRFVGRHPIATMASAAAVAAVLAASIAAVWQARRADAERERAQARLADVRRLANTLIFDMYDRIENTPNATPARRALVERGLAYLNRISVDAAADPQLSVELAEAYVRLAQVQGEHGQPNLGDRQAAVASLEKGRALLAPWLAGSQTPVAVELSDLRLLRRLAAAVVNDPDRARRLAAECVERSTVLRNRYPDRPEAIEAQASAYFSSALVADRDHALDSWSHANTFYRELSARLPDDPDALRSLALTEKYIGGCHHEDGNLELARAHYERALALDRRLLRLRPDDRRAAMDLAFDLGNVASVLWSSAPPDLVRAADLYRESLALRERTAAQDPQDVFARQAVGYSLVQLSDISRQQRQLDAAIDYGHRAVDVYEALPPSEQLVRRGSAWRALGQAAVQAGRRSEGCAALRRARDYYTRAAAAPPNERQALRPSLVTTLDEALKGCAP